MVEQSKNNKDISYVNLLELVVKHDKRKLTGIAYKGLTNSKLNLQKVLGFMLQSNNNDTRTLGQYLNRILKENPITVKLDNKDK